MPIRTAANAQEVTPREPRATLFAGMFVELPDRRGFGKVLKAHDDSCEVRLFHSIDHSEVVQYDPAAVERAFLSPQTRVYVRTREGWRFGRVQGFDPATAPWITYTVRFPNNVVGDFDEQALEVRVFDPHADPSEVLAHGGGETQFLHDRRWRALSSGVKLRGAAQGQTALLSSSIELAPHQIAACRRVLTDPVQRYLLADEVGMGKTIEAGVIARQCLIDDPRRRVHIFVPASLTDQWRMEMRDRCGAEDFRDGLEIHDHAQLARDLGAIDLLIVDEVHGLLANPGDYAALRDKAHAAPRLLLLSATPELGDTRRLLDLLHLIDPKTYGADDLEKLQARVDLGRDLGRLLMGLAEGQREFLVRRVALDLAARLRGDPKVQNLALEIAGNAGGPRAAAAELRLHLAENYRVHHRLIRARRGDAPVFFRARGQVVDGRRDHLREEVDEDYRWTDVVAALEDWRSDLRLETDEPACADTTAKMADRFMRAVEAIGFDPADLARARAFLDLPAGLAAVLAQDGGDRGRDVIGKESLLSLRDRIRRAGEPHPKIVVFASRQARADAFVDHLDDPGVVLLTQASNGFKGEEAIRRFRDDPAVWALVTDTAGEEGLNLNFADAILHLDLPFSVSRMEQRIGRLDRFGRSKSQVRQRILLPNDDDASPWAAWQELLVEGFGVYERSASDVQFVLGALENEIALALLERGAEGLRDMVPVVRARLEEARRAADEQYALDAIALADDAAGLPEALEDAEANETDLQAAAEGWLVSALQFQRRSIGDDDATFDYLWTKDTLVPKYPWKDEFTPAHARPLTWRRSVSTHRDAALLRPGARLIDTMDRFLRWEDRGSAFATWRVDPRVATQGVGWLGFRLCFVIEPAVPSDLDLFGAIDAGGLARRAQAFLPPWTHSLHLDLAGVAPDERVLSVLERPYESGVRLEGGADINLGSRPALMARVIDPALFIGACRDARQRAEAALRRDADFLAKVEAARGRAQQDRARRIATLGPSEVHAADVLLEAVTKPRVRLDSMGFFVLSGAPPAATVGR